MTLNKQTIVCFGPSDWWGMNPSCATHIMKKFSRCNRILYINPFSSDLLGVTNYKGLGARLLRKTKSLLKIVRKVNGNIVVLSPFFFPLQGIRAIDFLNNKLIMAQIRVVMFFMKMKEPVLWIENVRAADIIRHLKCKIKIYHVSDDFSQCPYTKFKKVLKERERYISSVSDIIICVSQQIYQNKKKLHRNVHYLPHGVDFENFRDSLEMKSNNVFSDLEHPVAGYFGTLTDQNDIDLLYHCALKLTNISFVFAGKVTSGDYSQLAKLPNVSFAGYIRYEKIPDLCANFDVCIMAWRQNEWVKNCNPLKLFEYMSSGKPIVSIPIAEVCKYSDVISVASTKEQFCDKINWELLNDTEERKQKRIEIARQHCWDNHNKKLHKIIHSNMNVKIEV